MLFVNGQKIEPTTFPDGTLSVRFSPNSQDYVITWLYDGDSECMLLWNIVHHIKESVRETTPEIYLRMPYIPNARMDRVKGCDEVFTLKWFAAFLNSLAFKQVEVYDPHSNVSTALIDHVVVIDAGEMVKEVLTELAENGVNDILLCYPDEGAAKRYSDQLEHEYIFCIKHRDWRTGKIEMLELTSPDKVRGRNILIVDDICSRGGTFTHTAKALKAAGAKEIFLYVSHCEDTIFKGCVLTDGLISRVFTTNSIFRGEHEKVSTAQRLWYRR